MGALFLMNIFAFTHKKKGKNTQRKVMQPFNKSDVTILTTIPNNEESLLSHRFKYPQQLSLSKGIPHGSNN